MRECKLLCQREPDCRAIFGTATQMGENATGTCACIRALAQESLVSNSNTQAARPDSRNLATVLFCPFSMISPLSRTPTPLRAVGTRRRCWLCTDPGFRTLPGDYNYMGLTRVPPHHIASQPLSTVNDEQMKTNLGNALKSIKDIYKALTSVLPFSRGSSRTGPRRRGDGPLARHRLRAERLRLAHGAGTGIPPREG